VTGTVGFFKSFFFYAVENSLSFPTHIFPSQSEPARESY
jgi:hypothetical protein